MKPLSNVESRRLERMWRADSSNEQRAKEHAEEIVKAVLRQAEERFHKDNSTKPMTHGVATTGGCSPVVQLA